MRSFRSRAQFIKKSTSDSQRRPQVHQSHEQHRSSKMLPQEDERDDIFSIPSQFRKPPPLQDKIISATSLAQEDTVDECIPLLTAALDPDENPLEFNEFGIPKLRSEDHVEFLRHNLSTFPAKAVGLDASRPWLVYWGLMGLYFLGEDAESARGSVLSTFFPLQNHSGGFGGGYGHNSHLATTYGTLLSIALAGGETNYQMIDRTAMWRWLGRLKRVSGGFQICEGAEEDTRGTYCALVIISLLNLPIELPDDAPSRASGFKTFNDGVGEYISRCQTYEGGISGTPGNEAHGAYVFCALGTLCLLGEPKETFARFLDVNALVWWMSSRQYAPEGGIAGRTNKLVDGCYSHWIGGCWPMIQAALRGPSLQGNYQKEPVGDLYSAEGLARYIICCCQALPGGLRDKPSKNPDSYHTCYTLSGISTTEHHHGYQEGSGQSQFDSAFSWWSGKKIQPDEPDFIPFEDGTDVKAMHPVYAIPHSSVDAIRRWSTAQPWQHRSDPAPVAA